MQREARNGLTDLLKFIFSVMVVLYHAKAFAGRGEHTLGTGGYIAVDFFFIAAGCFLAHSADRGGRAENVGLDTLRYMGRRLERIYPEFLVATMIALVLLIVREGFSPAMAELRESFGEWTMLQQAGFNDDDVVGATWFLSALLLASLMLYPSARKWRDGFFYVAAPIVFIALFGYSYRTLSTLQAPKRWINDFISIGMLRAVMEMCLGCWVYGLAKYARGWRLRGWARTAITLVELGIYTGVIVKYTVGRHSTKGDWMVILLLGVAQLITQSGLSYSGRWVRGRVFSWLGALSFSVYLGHRFWSVGFHEFAFVSGLPYGRMLCAYLAVSAVSALAVMYGGKLLRRAIAAVKAAATVR